MPTPVDVTLPDDRTIRVSRDFAAPRALVYECHTVPELVQRWLLGPPGWTMPVCDIDLRVGGSYRHVWRSEEDGSQFGFRGDYKEIVAPGRIVNTERWDGTESSEATDALCTLELTEAGGRTTLVHTMVFPSKESRDGALSTGMTDGMATSYDRLEREVLAEHLA